MSTFDRDATKEALPVVAQALMNGGVQGCDEFAAGAAVLDAARWAVAVTEGDGRLVRETPCKPHGVYSTDHICRNPATREVVWAARAGKEKEE